jgi:hypothetical protein
MEKVKTTFILGIILALFTIFASSNFLLLAWGSIIGYYSLIMLASFLGGVLIVDLERGLKLISIAYFASCIALVFLFVLPPMLYGEVYTGQIDVIVAVTLVAHSKNVIISFPVSIFTCIFGCFSGKALLERE